jgi:hypothetical protein
MRKANNRAVQAPELLRHHGGQSDFGAERPQNGSFVAAHGCPYCHPSCWSNQTLTIIKKKNGTFICSPREWRKQSIFPGSRPKIRRQGNLTHDIAGARRDPHTRSYPGRAMAARFATELRLGTACWHHSMVVTNGSASPTSFCPRMLPLRSMWPVL